MESTEVYDEFLKKVERSIYIDNSSPAVTESVLKAAFNQFGNVTSVQFIPLLLQLKGIQAALVEMENTQQANIIISSMETTPFMIGGMPRPARAKATQEEMFGDRPRKPGHEIRCRWLDPGDPKCEVAEKIKEVVKIHAEEDAFLLEQQLLEEEKLSETQSETQRYIHEKLKLLEGIWRDGSVPRLMDHYGFRPTGK